MATIDHARNDNGSFTWEGLTGSDVGADLNVPRGAIITTVQLTGTFGGTVPIQGTVNGVDWFTLTDAQGNAAEATAASAIELTTAARAIRPSAGAGVSDVDVHVAISA